MALTDLAAPILDLIDQYGLAALFFFLMLDAAMLLPLVPGELLLILAVNRFANDRLSLGILVLVASLAATAGNTLLYYAARLSGRRFAVSHPRLFLLGPGGVENVERLFRGPAGWFLVMFLRVVPVLRLLVSLPAGLARMPLVLFAILTLIGNTAFHAGFMYLAFESSQPESPFASKADELRESYATPAWTYVQANWLLTCAVVLALGIALSVRASLRVGRRPHQAFKGSLIGSLATATLFWGGVGLLAGLWIDPPLVYDAISLTGYDLRTMIFDVPYAPLSVAVAGGAGAVLLGLFASGLRRSARRHAKAARRPSSLAEEVERRR